jgi:peptide/nickel transport system substrate-binding protein
MLRHFKRYWLTILSLASLLLLVTALACGGGSDTSAASSSSTEAVAEDKEVTQEEVEEEKEEYKSTASTGTTFVSTPTPKAATAEAKAAEDAFKVGDRRLTGDGVEIKYGEPNYGGIMETQALSGIGSWDPHYFVRSGHSPMISPQHNSLLQFNPWTFDRYDIWGDLAESWSVDNDESTQFTFKLKKHATWWDGTPVLASDVAYSFDRMLGRDGFRDKPSTEAGRYLLPHFGPVIAVDDHTVQINLIHPWADFFGYMANDLIMMTPQAHYTALDQNDDPAIWDIQTGYKHQMGSGPFIPSNVVDNSTWSYVANENYWKKDPDGRGLPYLGGMNYYVITDRTAAQAAWEADQLWNTNWQTNGNMNPGTMQDMIERHGDKYVAYPAACCPSGLGFNTGSGPLANPKVREAINLALDRQTFNQLVWAGLGLYGTWGGPPGHPLGMTAEEVLALPGWRVPKDADVARAQQLMAEAGYPDGFSTSYITSNALNAQDGGPVIADTLRRFLKIDVEHIVLERLAMAEARSSGKFEMMDAGSGAGVITPDQYLNQHFKTDAEIGGNTFNWHNWDAPGLQDLIALQSSILDVAERKKVVREILEIVLLGDTHVPMLFTKTYARLVNTEKVHGQNPTQSGYVETKAEQLWLVNP